MQLNLAENADKPALMRSLLDFDEVDPVKLLHDFQDDVEFVKNEFKRLPENPYLRDSEIEELIPVGQHPSRDGTAGCTA